ncbi:MAG TPA: DUF4157 domain-containing protein [Kofleriaceae bacterium]|nr:DUF4157 domain-containing protein [Kofleriaceae bacterium]
MNRTRRDGGRGGEHDDDAATEHVLGPGKRTRTAAGSGAPPVWPGKRTLTQNLVARPPAPVPAGVDRPGRLELAIAQRGVAGASSSLPHADRIQRAFGHHDISSIRVQVGGDATTASHAIGARAYAHGERIAFASAPDLHTAAHEATHVIQQRAGLVPAGGMDSPGDALERQAHEVADAVVAGHDVEGMLDRIAASGGSAAIAVQRDSDAAPSLHAQRQMLEFYLVANSSQAWRRFREHARSIQFPNPHPRLSWVSHQVFVEKLLLQITTNIDFKPIAMLDEILYPTTALRTLGALLPATDAWSPPLGLALAQALQLAIVNSLRRLGQRYVEVADSKGVSGEGGVEIEELITSMPIDRYVRVALGWPRAVTLAPLDSKSAAQAKGTHVPIRKVTLAWEGARDPKLWNWVRAVEPADASAEEVAATLWEVTDQHGDAHASFNAYLLAAAPPLFGIPKRFAIDHPKAKPYAPAHALAGHDSVNAELVELARTRGADDVALAQTPAEVVAIRGKQARPAPDVASVIGVLGDCSMQLTFVMAEVSRWGFADHVAPALGFVLRKQGELLTADSATLAQWARVVAGQFERLGRIASHLHQLAQASGKLGIKDPKAPEAMPVREIVGLYATAAGISHLATSSEATLRQALELQAGLNARAVQATERDLEAANLEIHDAMGLTKTTAQFSSETVMLQDRSRQLQTQMINGEQVDPAELDEVTLASEETALSARLLATIHSTFELHEAAIHATDGIAAHIASLFSGKFRGLPNVCSYIEQHAGQTQNGWRSEKRKLDEAAQRQVATPEQKAKHRAARRALLAKAQAEFRQLGDEKDLQRFFRESAKVIRNQQFRTACVRAAALIGIGILAAATGGAVAELAGGMLMEAEGVATVAELSTMARVGAQTAGLVTEAGVNAAGQVAVQGGSFKDAFLENMVMSAANVVVLGPLGKATAKTAALEERAAGMWRRVGRGGLVVLKEGAAITAHTIWGAAIGYVSHRVVTGETATPQTVQDWMLQGGSVVVGRYVHKSLGERMPSFERLAKRTEIKNGQKLLQQAHQLQELAKSVEHSKDALQAIELLEKRERLLQQELEAIDALIGWEGDKSGALRKSRNELKAQLEEARSQALFDTKFELLGLRELVPGALWRGSPEQCLEAAEMARARGGKAAHEPDQARWRITVDDREILVQEVAASVDVQRVMIAGHDRMLIAAAKLVPPKPGYLDVIVHGTVDDLVVKVDGGERHFDHRALAKFIEKSGHKFEAVRLLSCSTGKHPKGVAQHLANQLGVVVEAPTDKLWIHPDGTLTIGPHEDRNTGKWEPFRPKQSELRYQKVPEPEPAPRGRGRAKSLGPEPKPTVEIPQKELEGLHKRVDDHVKRIVGDEIQDPTPAILDQLTEAGRRAAEDRFRKNVAQKQAMKNARLPAGNDAKAAIEALVGPLAIERATQRAHGAIADGSVFDHAKLPPDAQAQLAQFKAGRSRRCGEGDGAETRRSGLRDARAAARRRGDDVSRSQAGAAPARSRRSDPRARAASLRVSRRHADPAQAARRSVRARHADVQHRGQAGRTGWKPAGAARRRVQGHRSRTAGSQG